MRVNCPDCNLSYDDADRSTCCPHELIMPINDLIQKKAALELCEKDICFAHQPDGPVHRVQAINWNGMVTLYDMVGQFAPHLFIVARKK